MWRPLVAWASCVAVVAASLQSCKTQKFDDAFLSNVTAGLPLGHRKEFCHRGGTNVIVAPEDNGIVHYVLQGSIATDKLGKQNGDFLVLRVGEVAALNTVQTPGSLHFWMRAMCIG